MNSTIRCPPWLWLLMPLLSACGTTAAARVDGESAASTAPASFPEQLKGLHVSGELMREFDLDGDQKPDLWKYYRTGEDGSERLARKELDLNHDGRVDVWRYYGDREVLAVEAYDFDFDGQIDQINFYEKGAVVRKERDLSGDGATDLWIFYDQGKIARKERDSTGNGKVDYWEYWEDGQIGRIGEDLDGDGEVDRWSKAPSEEDAEAGAP